MAEELQHDRFVNTDVKVVWRSFGEYLAKLADLKPIVNVIPCGTRAIRACVFGIEDRAPSSDELKAMKN